MQPNTSNSNIKTGLFVLLSCSFSLFSFIAGLIIGLVVLGWLIWPVQWVDAAPPDLHPAFQRIYVEMIVDTFESQPDVALARSRLSPWGEQDALALLRETYQAAQTQGLVFRAAHIQTIISTYETAP